MDLNTVLSFIIVAGQIAMFFFFKEQIKSKNRVVEDLRTLMDTTDIKRLAEYYKDTDTIRSKRMLEEVKLELHNWKLEQFADWGRKFDEVANFAVLVLSTMPKEKIEPMIQKHMPNCGEVFKPFIESLRGNNGDVSNNTTQHP